MLFDPMKKRKNAMVDFLINTKYDPDSPMGNVAATDILMLIGYWMVGLKSETEVILPSHIQWIQKAIDDNETLKNRYGEEQDPYFHKYQLYEHLALAKWLDTGKDSISDWQHAKTIYGDNYVKRQWWETRSLKTYGLDDYLALCIQAQDYEAGIKEFEHYYGQKNISLKRKTITPREYGYLVCQNQLNRIHDNQAMIEVGRKLLAKYLEDTWLGYGQFARAAQWLKIVYWHHGEDLTPEQTLLKIYENIPSIETPEFIKPKL